MSPECITSRILQSYQREENKNCELLRWLPPDRYYPQPYGLHEYSVSGFGLYNIRQLICVHHRLTASEKFPIIVCVCVCASHWCNQCAQPATFCCTLCLYAFAITMPRYHTLACLCVSGLLSEYNVRFRLINHFRRNGFSLVYIVHCYFHEDARHISIMYNV